MKNPLQGANTQMADPNAEPTIPQPAATVLLVRDSKEDGVEVFLVERASKANFGGAFVFPGGKVDPEDGLDHVEIITTGASDKELSNIFLCLEICYRMNLPIQIITCSKWAQFHQNFLQ